MSGTNTSVPSSSPFLVVIVFENDRHSSVDHFKSTFIQAVGSHVAEVSDTEVRSRNGVSM